MDGATAIIALSTVISYVKNCTKNSYCVLFRKNEGLSFSRAQIQFFFLDCQDDNSIFSLDRLFYTRVSSHMCHPDTFRITGHYSTLSALFFCCAKFFILSFPSIWDSERVNPCHECCSLSRDFRDKSDRRRKSYNLSEASERSRVRMKKIWKIADVHLSFFLSQVSFIRQERNWSEYADLDARSSGAQSSNSELLVASSSPSVHLKITMRTTHPIWSWRPKRLACLVAGHHDFWWRTRTLWAAMQQPSTKSGITSLSDSSITRSWTVRCQFLRPCLLHLLTRWFSCRYPRGTS